MRIFVRYNWRIILPEMLTVAVLLSVVALFSCGKADSHKVSDEREALRQVLLVQSLYNNNPGDDIVPQIAEVVDSMRRAGRSPYYFAAVNVLIDRLFSDGRFAEADSLAVVMEKDAKEVCDSVSMAMAHRVRAQMLYKLSQSQRAMQEISFTDNYISNPYISSSNFGTASNILEWKWIIARELGDTAAMNSAGLHYAHMVSENMRINRWEDASQHYPVTAFAFKAQDAFSKGNLSLARELLDSASAAVLPLFPARAYEHLYSVRSELRAHDADWQGAIADVDTLLNTHREFPWFYVRDLRLKADVLNMAGKHEESAKAYSRYIDFYDSLSNRITEKRLNDLTVLYRSELDEAQKRTAEFRTIAFCSVIIFLLILLGVAYYLVKKEKKRNQILVKRLKDVDEVVETVDRIEHESPEISAIDKLDGYMLKEQPYTNPALSRKELAEFMGISQEAIGQLIKTEKGTSVRTYINSFRLEEARKILGSDSNEGIAEMAVRLGFGTSRTFQRAFKERYDMSPTQYRDAARQIHP